MPSLPRVDKIAGFLHFPVIFLISPLFFLILFLIFLIRVANSPTSRPPWKVQTTPLYIGIMVTINECCNRCFCYQRMIQLKRTQLYLTLIMAVNLNSRVSLACWNANIICHTSCLGNRWNNQLYSSSDVWCSRLCYQSFAETLSLKYGGKNYSYISFFRWTKDKNGQMRSSK